MFFPNYRIAVAAATAAVLALVTIPSANAATLTTVAERSGFKDTDRYEEVIALCTAYQKTYPAAVRCVNFGRTPEGRPMLALIATRTMVKTAENARKRASPRFLCRAEFTLAKLTARMQGS